MLTNASKYKCLTSGGIRMSSLPATRIRSASVGFGFGFDGFCRERKVELGLARFVPERSRSFNCLMASPTWLSRPAPDEDEDVASRCAISRTLCSYRIFLSLIGCSAYPDVCLDRAAVVPTGGERSWSCVWVVRAWNPMGARERSARAWCGRGGIVGGCGMAWTGRRRVDV